MNSKKNLFLKLRVYPVRNCVHSRRKFDISNGVYAIIDNNFLSKSIIKRKNISCIQIRQKNRPSVSLIKRTKDIKKRFRIYNNMPILVNDRVDVALAANADGLHVGRGDMAIKLLRNILGKNYIIGKTVRGVKQAKIAEIEGADYISIGPIFKTPLKKELKPKELSVLKKVKNSISIPVVAIGGINFSNRNKVLAAGADGVAMMRGIKGTPHLRAGNISAERDTPHVSVGRTGAKENDSNRRSKKR